MKVCHKIITKLQLQTYPFHPYSPKTINLVGIFDALPIRVPRVQTTELMECFFNRPMPMQNIIHSHITHFCCGGFCSLQVTVIIQLWKQLFPPTIVPMLLDYLKTSKSHFLNDTNNLPPCNVIIFQVTKDNKMLDVITIEIRGDILIIDITPTFKILHIQNTRNDHSRCCSHDLFDMFSGSG